MTAATSHGAATATATKTHAAACRTSDADAAAEESLRPPQEHRDHDEERDGILVRVGDVAAGERLGDADQKARRDRAVDVAEAARHDGRERLERQPGAHVGED